MVYMVRIREEGQDKDPKISGGGVDRRIRKERDREREGARERVKVRGSTKEQMRSLIS